MKAAMHFYFQRTKPLFIRLLLNKFSEFKEHPVEEGNPGSQL